MLKQFSFFIAIAVCLFAAQAPGEEAVPSTLTAQGVIERIKIKVGVEWSASTVDTFKAGDPTIKVTGITTTMFPTLEVLKKSVAAGNNLIICHEPTFYNHMDQTKPLENDEVQLAKQHYVAEHKLAIFRFHDHWHRMKPDGIVEGMVDALNWRNHRRKNEQTVFDLDATTVGELAKTMKDKLKASAVRVVGDSKLSCSKIALLAGAAGSMTQIAALQRDDIDVLVCGEAREWETVEYARDAIESGKHKALIVLGHAPSEEAGMDYCAHWLSGIVTEVPVKFIPCRDPFWAP